MIPQERREVQKPAARKNKNATGGKIYSSSVYGVASRVNDWGRAAYGVTAKKAAQVWSWLDPVAHGFIRVGAWSAPKIVKLTLNTAILVSCKKGKDGHRHFDAWYLSKNIVKTAIVVTAGPIVMSAGYYYGTWDTHIDVYIPNAGVFVNQQFVKPSEPGKIIAPRDEVFTVLGKQIGPKGEIEPVRFDLDANMFFFFYADSLRPDLAASKLDSQSPYGVKCTLETTGLYNRLPRYMRFYALQWWDLRPEVVRVVRCEELKELPPAFYQAQGKPVPVPHP